MIMVGKIEKIADHFFVLIFDSILNKKNMHIYTGYFTSLKNVHYKVIISPRENDGTEQEILLSGSQPFVVAMENGGSPFEPMRKSTATINIVSKSYLTEVLSPHPQGTAVYLQNLDENITEWRGYLKPNLYNQPYENCTEVISLEASDALSALQYLKYETKNQGVKGIVDFHYLIDYMCKMIDIPEWYVMSNKYDKKNNVLLPKDLIISEQNFFSSDTDEPWTLETLMTEVMKYLGYTAYQWKGNLWLTDYAMFNVDTYNPEMIQEMPYVHYTVGNTVGENISVPATAIVESTNFRGTGADVSIDNIYNKITVKDSLYEVEGLLPQFFDENVLIPRLGDVNSANEMPIIQEQICNSSGKFVNDANDRKYQFFTKPYDHPAWESVYYDKERLTELKDLTEDDLKNKNLLSGRLGGTLVDEGNVHSTEYGYDISSSLTFKKYLYLNMSDKNELLKVFSYETKESEDGDFNEFVHINYALESPDTYKTMFRLKKGYHLPMILGEQTFLALQATAMFERHATGYINPDWSSEAGGWYKGCDLQIYASPKLIFLLRIGDQYWNGTAWQDTACAFLVPLQYDRDENFKVKSTDWNKEQSHFNNVPWSDWAAVDGVKIPLDGVRDVLGEVQFEVKMPPKLLYYSGGTEKGVKNGSCWISNLNMQIVNKDSKLYEDKDIIYENVIDDKSLNEYAEQEFKITTYPAYGKASYSHVGRKSDGRYFDWIITEGISDRWLRPEEALMDKLYTQYSTPTKMETLNLDLSFTPQMKVRDEWWWLYFSPQGTTIDYANDKQSITLVETKEPIYENWLTMERTDAGYDSLPYYAYKIEVEVDSAYPYTISANTVGFTVVNGEGSMPTKHTLTIPGNDAGTITEPRDVVITCKNTKGMTATLTLKQNGHATNYSFIHYDPTGCIACEGCSSYFGMCPVGIRMTGFGGGSIPTIVDPSTCIACQGCLDYIDMCPSHCFSMQPEPMTE